MQRFVENGNIDAAIASARRACAQAIDALRAASDGEDAQFLEMAAILGAVGKEAAGAALGISQAALAFKVILPSAASLAPGLMRGAIKVKQLVPQSSIPGMFVIVLPWLYSPLVWAVYSVVSQAVGSIWLLLGLVVLAYGFLGNFVIGAAYQVAKPMDSASFARVKRALSAWAALKTLVANALLLYFLVGSGESSQLFPLLRYLISPASLVAVAFAGAAKWLTTSVAGVDFMIGEIASQREFELYLESGGVGFAARRSLFERNGSRERLNLLMRQRDSGLDDLLAISRKQPETRPKRASRDGFTAVAPSVPPPPALLGRAQVGTSTASSVGVSVKATSTGSRVTSELRRTSFTEEPHMVTAAL